MTPKQLTYFTRIAESGSFSAASKQLHIAQSALSHQISNLEAELGLHLFFRKSRGVELTGVGKRLLKHAYSIQRHIEAVLLDIQSEELDPEGEIRVGMVPTINNAFASKLFHASSQKYPNLKLEIVGGASKYLNHQIENRHIDIALVHSDSDGFGELLVTPIFNESLFFVGASHKTYPHITKSEEGGNMIRFADIVNYQILSTEAQDGLGFRINQYEQETGIELNKRPSLGQLSSDLNEILVGAAQMILPWSAIYHLVDERRLTTALVVEPKLERDIFLLTNPKSQLTNNIIKTRSLIQELIPDIFLEGRSVGRLIDGF